jgi:pilus assembly protein CpaE
LTGLIQQGLVRHGYECPTAHVSPLSDARRVAESRPDLVILVLAPDPARALTTLAEVRAAVPGKVLAVGPDDDPKLILRALRAGADDFVLDTELDSELSDALVRLSTDARAGAAAGKTLAVLAASGGSGASTVAVNLAAALAKEHGGSVLIDLKLETGDLADLLDLRPPHTLADLCGGMGPPDRAMFDQSLAAHRSGVQLLASPRRQASILRAPGSGAGEPVTADGVRQVLAFARAARPYVVVEVSPTFREEQVQALKAADAVLLVLRLDFPSLRNARRALEHLELVGVSRDKVRVVANRHGQPHALSQAEAEKALGLKLYHLVPDDPKVMNQAANVGEPAVVGAPRSASAKSLQALAVGLNGKAQRP